MLFGGTPQLEKDEQRIFTGRSHSWLIIRAVEPLILLLLSPLLYMTLDALLPTLNLAAVFPAFVWIATVAFLAYLLKWLLLDVLPWTQRIYILTDRRVIAQWGVLAIRRRECSLLKMQECDYKSTGFMARLLNFGNVEVQTAGRMGDIVFRAVPQPRKLQGMISSQARIVREEENRRRLDETPKEIMRQLAAATGKSPRPDLAPTEPFTPVSSQRVQRQKKLNLLPDEIVIEVMRQHLLVPLIGVLAPCVAIGLVIAITAVFGRVLVPFAIGIIGLVLLPWAAWHVLGYLCHEYVLTTERLIERRSMPLLFETQNIVQLDSVQDILLGMPLIIGRLADVGDVIVEVGGSAQRMALKTVTHPEELQKRIFEIIDQRKDQQHASEDQRLVSTLSQWFSEYHKLQESEEAGKQ